MAVIPANFFDQFGAELQTLRGLEAIWEWMTKVDGSTFFKDKINSAYSNVIQREDDAETASKDNLKDSIAPSTATNHASRLSAFETFFFAFIDDAINTVAVDQSGAISYTYDPTLLAAGQPKITDRVGRLGALRRAMIADAVTIKENVVAISVAFAGLSTNQGVLVASGQTFEDHALAGDFVFEVTDDTVDAPKLSVTLNLLNRLIDSSVGKRILASNPIQVGKSYEDGPTALSILLALGPVVKTGDDGVIFSTAPVITSPSESDSAKGQHFIVVTRLAVGGAGPHFRMEWFRSGSLLVTDRVTFKDITGEAGTEVIVLLGAISQISVTFDKAAAVIKLPAVPNADNDIIFDIKTPRINDQFTMTITNDEGGLFATKVARRYRASLNSVTSGSETIDDSKAVSIAIT